MRNGPGIFPKGETVKKIREYAEYFGVSHMEAYFELVDMGEIRESENLLNRAERLDLAVIRNGG